MSELELEASVSEEASTYGLPDAEGARMRGSRLRSRWSARISSPS